MEAAKKFNLRSRVNVSSFSEFILRKGKSMVY